MLLQLAVHQGAAIAAGAVRQGFEAVILLDRVHQHLHRQGPADFSEIALESTEPLVAVGEHVATGKVPVAPVRRADLPG